MDERLALLKAIYCNTRDRTPLLVYADWLQERPELPASEATVEFIRLACEGKSSRRTTAPANCLDWLKENWKRLIPSVEAIAERVKWARDGYMDLEGGDEQPFGYGSQITNYLIDTIVGIAGKTFHGKRTYPCRLKIKVGFGLLLRAEMKSAWGKKQVWPLLGKDQPQLTMDLNWTGPMSLERMRDIETSDLTKGLFADEEGT